MQKKRSNSKLRFSKEDTKKILFFIQRLDIITFSLNDLVKSLMGLKNYIRSSGILYDEYEEEEQ